MESRGTGLTLVHTVQERPQGWEGPVGFVNAELLENHVPNLEEQLFYVSGPPAMVEHAFKCLDTLGVGKDRITHEELTGYEGMV